MSLDPDDWSHDYRRRTTARASQGAKGFPSTYAPVTRQSGVTQNGVFDPALKQFIFAYRAGYPVFSNPELGARWQQTQQRVMDHVLAAVAGSAAAANLVLRGSRLMHAWFGDAARPPGDLDWVVSPATIVLGEADSTRLFGDVLAAISASSILDDSTRIDMTKVAMEDLWTYERAPGRRIVVPWSSEDLPDGVVQMDFVFCEQLAQPAVTMSLPVVGGKTIAILAASPELSLAWKLLWLETDMYPQGKDLYDAVLLAERFTVPLPLLRDVLGRELGRAASEFTADSVSAWEVDWLNFLDEYPEITGGLPEWKARLARALGSSFRE